MRSPRNFSLFNDEKSIEYINMQELLLNISDGCYYLNAKMEFMFVNKSAEAILEKSKEELLGFCIWDILPKYIETDIYKLYNHSYKNQQPASFVITTEYANKTLRIKVIPDSKGILVLLSDITVKRAQDEKEIYFEKLRIIGEMAAGVAHEVRNPLTTVKGFLQLVAQDEDLLKFKDIFILMIEEIDRINIIISEFLDIAKNKPSKLEKQNLNKIIQSINPLLKTRALKEDKIIRLQLNPIPSLKLDQNEMRQLLINMVNNSLDAMEPNSSVQIKTYLEEGKVVLSISDEGTGIPSDIMDIVSTPFVTSKEKGTGLGLAISFAIAKRNHAIIDYSSDSTGTTFNIRFTI
ncbi:ATP-binding protein [Cytobacillus purgationiresistens]|uniref:histidine kinase n=1 Tax=Cytobacillus purgationiresistens TaxID=863449 RepID=A0ABU0ANJ0_9BACI|nr:ATP-binding protein [Cytobacillus purgationiresistens]MDQ0271625.1 signal transduction histidine kinase [Cytobacillus purgationiresistens]